MKRAFLGGAVVGALLAIGLGFATALLPTTPTWALWQITRATGSRNFGALSDMVD